MTTHKAIKPSTTARFALAAALLAAVGLTGCNADSVSSEPFRPMLASSFNGEAVSNLSAGYSAPVPTHHASRPHGSYSPTDSGSTRTARYTDGSPVRSR